jgi:hypothetical protein
MNELDKRSDDNKYMLPYWELTDTIVEGLDALKAAGAKYLPKFADETKEDYQVRLDLATMTNIYRDVVESLASKPFEQEITLVGENQPTEIVSFTEDVDGSGNNLSVFSAMMFFNGINSAIAWVFVDYPDVAPGTIRTVADAKAAGVRPFWSHILARNVLEVRSELINGKEVLSYVRLLEGSKVRIMERDATGARWALHYKTETNGKIEWIKEKEGVFSIGVIPLVPFATGRRDGRSWRFYPAMRDAADLQRLLYRQESALEFTKTMAAFPMLAGNGVKPVMDADGKTPKRLAIGPARVLYAPPDGNGNNGSWEFIEPSGETLTFLANNIKETQQNLRELGRQPLTAQSGNLTTITTAVAAGKAKSAVAAWAYGLKDALENAFKITAMWLGQTYEPEVDVYTDFDNFSENGADLEQLGKARERGDISLETYWFEMKRRRVLSSDFDAEKERERLLLELPGDPLPEENPVNG